MLIGLLHDIGTQASKFAALVTALTSTLADTPPWGQLALSRHKAAPQVAGQPHTGMVASELLVARWLVHVFVALA